MKKAAFFDIDGTLLDHNNVIPQSTVEGIHKLQEKGNYAFLCTGRSRAYVRSPALMEIGFDGIISGCGTMIEFHDEVVFYKKLDNAFVKTTVDFLKEHHAPVIMEGRFKLYVDPADFEGDLYIARLRKELGESLLPITGNEEEWEVSKFSCATQNADMELLKERLLKDFELLIHDVPVMELVPKGCSKGTGILAVCERLGIPIEDTYAFGDSANDLPMFAVAGHSIAMGNGTELAKQKASYVTDSMHEDGIYHALEYFGLI
ncbi:MAG: HAD family hydrolase [Eubacterium sp.]|nr:HAD family hydrolase [Eubacterium sp.]